MPIAVALPGRLLPTVELCHWAHPSGSGPVSLATSRTAIQYYLPPVLLLLARPQGGTAGSIVTSSILDMRLLAIWL